MPALRERPACPQCGSTNLRYRVTKPNPFICQTCGYAGQGSEFAKAKATPNRTHFVADGMAEFSADEFQSFPARLIATGKRIGIAIPTTIRRKLKLKRGEFIEVAIRKQRLSELSRTYGPLARWLPIRKWTPQRVICPKCNVMGLLYFYLKRQQFFVKHGICDGLLKSKICYISRKKYPEQCKIFDTLKKVVKINE